MDTRRGRSGSVDLDLALFEARVDWTPLRNSVIFFTGATGFIGTWMLEALSFVNKRMNLGIRVVAQSREPLAAGLRLEWLREGLPIDFVGGDIRSGCSFEGSADIFIHGATDARADLNRDRPFEMFDSIVTGTRNALESASRAGAARFLQLSSGAVYGKAPQGKPFRETDTTGPDPLASGAAYAEGKRAAEQLCAIAARGGNIPCVSIARCFAFVGPGLPLDAHFAIGNFIRDGLRGGDIEIAGDGTAVRSYLHAADLAVWLWNILLRGQSLRPYNVGSEEGLSIRQIAEVVAQRFEHRPAVRVRGAPGSSPADVYVPNTERARDELGLEAWTSLSQAIDRTIEWHRRNV